MAIAVAQTARAGDLREEIAQDFLVARWIRWSREAKDVGTQTRAVLSRNWVSTAPGGNAAQARMVAEAFHKRTGRSGGNGSLMRTAPVALAYLDDPDGLTEAAIAVSRLTHFDSEAAEACVLWCHAIRHAVLTGELNAHYGLGELHAQARARWEPRLYAAQYAVPSDFRRNGWVVEALQAAWCAISTTREESTPATHLQNALKAAVRGGNDTDTVAAIAGGLLGAAYGETAVPPHWRKKLHGWPGMDASALGALAESVSKSA